MNEFSSKTKDPATAARASPLRLGLIFGSSLLLACLLLGQSLPPRHLAEVSNKLEYFDHHFAEFDTLFIGSSRIYHGISPKVFDAETGREGCPTHSFNLAANDMKPPESFEMLRQSLRLHPVRHIFLEWTKLQIDPHGPLQTTARDVAWHNARWTWSVLREVAGGRRRHLYCYHASELWRIHLSLGLQNLVNLGRAHDLMIPSDDAWQLSKDLGPARDGYCPRDAHAWSDEPIFQKRVLQIEQGLAAIEWLDDPKLTELVIRLSEECKQHGTQLLLVIPPSLISVPQPPPNIPLFVFNDPNRYPLLFSTSLRSDWEHLDEHGAIEFSRDFARAYLAQLGSAK